MSRLAGPKRQLSGSRISSSVRLTRAIAARKQHERRARRQRRAHGQLGAALPAQQPRKLVGRRRHERRRLELQHLPLAGVVAQRPRGSCPASICSRVTDVSSPPTSSTRNRAAASITAVGPVGQRIERRADDGRRRRHRAQHIAASSRASRRRRRRRATASATPPRSRPRAARRRAAAADRETRPAAGPRARASPPARVRGGATTPP